MPLLLRYWPHMRLTLLILGGPLFVALILGLAIEAWLQGPEFIPAIEQVDLTLIGKMMSLVLTAVRLALPVTRATLRALNCLFMKVFNGLN